MKPEYTMWLVGLLIAGGSSYFGAQVSISKEMATVQAQVAQNTSDINRIDATMDERTRTRNAQMDVLKEALVDLKVDVGTIKVLLQRMEQKR